MHCWTTAEKTTREETTESAEKNQESERRLRYWRSSLIAWGGGMLPCTLRTGLPAVLTRAHLTHSALHIGLLCAQEHQLHAHARINAQAQAQAKSNNRTHTPTKHSAARPHAPACRSPARFPPRPRAASGSARRAAHRTDRCSHCPYSQSLRRHAVNSRDFPCRVRGPRSACT